MASGDTKTEALLNILGHGGTGDEYRGSGNTKTQNYILDAIDRINSLDPGGGGSDFTVLTDADANYTEEWSGDVYIALWKLESGNYRISPEASVSIGVNVIDDGDDIVVDRILVPSDDTYTFKVYNPDPNTSDVRFTIFSTVFIQEVYTDKNGYLKNTGIVNPYQRFIGISGNADGTMGLVPAPTTDDVDKFLKSDGTWADLDGITFLDLTISDASHIADGYIDFTPAHNNTWIHDRFTEGKTVVARVTIPTSVGVFSAGTYYFLPSFQNSLIYFASGSSYSPQTRQWLTFTYSQGPGVSRLYFKANSGNTVSNTTFYIDGNTYSPFSSSGDPTGLLYKDQALTTKATGRDFSEALRNGEVRVHFVSSNSRNIVLSGPYSELPYEDTLSGFDYQYPTANFSLAADSCAIAFVDGDPDGTDYFTISYFS